MKKILLLLIMTSLLIAASCNKEDEQPEPSTKPHEIVRCKINGEDWYPYREGISSGIYVEGTTPFRLNYYDYDGLLVLVVSNENKKHLINILCHFSGIDDNNKLLTSSAPFRDYGKSDLCQNYNLDTTKVNFIKVLELDSINFIMKGEFEFSAINDCGDEVSITDGYFDLHYRF